MATATASAGRKDRARYRPGRKCEAIVDVLIWK
jgi:hypothetical protein